MIDPNFYHTLKVLGVNQDTPLRITSKATLDQYQKLLTKLYRILATQYDDVVDLQAWLNTSNPYLKQKPAVLLRTVPGIHAILKYLSEHVYV